VVSERREYHRKLDLAQDIVYRYPHIAHKVPGAKIKVMPMQDILKIKHRLELNTIQHWCAKKI
jgi:hypothetical protein